MKTLSNISALLLDERDRDDSNSMFGKVLVYSTQ